MIFEGREALCFVQSYLTWHSHHVCSTSKTALGWATMQLLEYSILQNVRPMSEKISIPAPKPICNLAVACIKAEIIPKLAFVGWSPLHRPAVTT